MSFSDIFASVVSIMHAGDPILLKDSVCIYLKEALEFGNCCVKVAVAVDKNKFTESEFLKHKQNPCKTMFKTFHKHRDHKLDRLWLYSLPTGCIYA